MMKINYLWQARRYSKTVLKMTAMGLPMLFPLCGWAAGTCTGSEDYTPLTVNMPAQINVDPSVAIGQPIGTFSASYPLTRTIGQCGIPGPGSVQLNGVGKANGKVYPIINTNLGYRIKYTAGNLVQGINNVYWPVTGYYNEPNFTTTGVISSGTVTVDLIKLGPIPGGFVLPAMTLGTYDIIPTGGKTYKYFQFNSSPTDVVPTNPACTVTSSVIPVPLESVNDSKFKMAGDTAGDKSFSIPLSCNQNVNVALSFSGTMVDSNNGVFKNTNSVTGSSVGIQLLDKNGNPVVSNQAVTVGAINGTVSYPMTARYYALASNVPAGDVSAIAYATIVYN